MLSRPAIRLLSRHRTQCPRRANSTLDSLWSNSQENPVPEGSRIPRTSFQRSGRHCTDSIFIKSWDVIECADAYAIIRAVERKYGRLREFRFWRDRERPQILQTHIFAIFRSPESLRQVPEQGEVIHIPAPLVDHNRPGGVGLGDLMDLLGSQDKTDDVELPGWGSVMSRVLATGQEEPPKRVLDVRVERAARNWVLPSSIEPRLPTRARIRATGHAFLDWGGFHPHPPSISDSGTSNTEAPVPSSESPQPKVNPGRMQLALKKWSEFTFRPIPSSSSASQTAMKGDSAPEDYSTVSDRPTTGGVESPLSPAKFSTEENKPIEWDPIPEATLLATTDDTSDVMPAMTSGTKEKRGQFLLQQLREQQASRELLERRLLSKLSKHNDHDGAQREGIDRDDVGRSEEKERAVQEKLKGLIDKLL